MLSDAELLSIRNAGLIDDAKLAEIHAYLIHSRQGGVPAPPARFDLTHVLWYAGALIIIGAMGLFTNEAFNRMGGWALAGCGAAYAAVFLAAGHMLWKRDGLRVPAGLLITVAISMVPLIIFGLQDAHGLWNDTTGDPGKYKDFFAYINGSWIYMEIGTIIAAAIAIWRYPFTFIMLIGAVALWFLSMDIAIWFAPKIDGYVYADWEFRRNVSLYFGLAMILVAWAVDILRGKRTDFVFWIHIFAAFTFWAGMTLHDGGSELQKFIYCLINIGMILLSVFLNRRVYAVFGTIGVAIYLGYLANDVFKDAIMFSFALSAIGLGVIGLGLLLHRNRPRLVAAMDNFVPQSLAWIRPDSARSTI